MVVEGRAPEPVRSAVEGYFGGDVRALDGLTVATGGTDFQRTVWKALRAIPAGETRT
jgi:methylated-DNA-[protein]-cysteine S-methyltransferase